MNKLAQYGGRMLRQGKLSIVELRDPNDNAKPRFQYALIEAQLHKRILNSKGEVMVPWERIGDDGFLAMIQQRGQFHPILDPLGL